MLPMMQNLSIIIGLAIVNRTSLQGWASSSLKGMSSKFQLLKRNLE